MKTNLFAVFLLLGFYSPGFSSSRISDLLYNSQWKKKPLPDFMETREGDEALRFESLERAFHPNLDFSYFQFAQENPFRPEITKYDPLNAWWMAEAAFISYTDGEFLERNLKKAGFDSLRFFGTPETDSQGFVAASPKWILVSFRGTEPTKFQDLLTDSDFLLEISGQGGKVHSGFLEAFTEIWSTHGMRDFVDSLLEAKQRPLWFTGHSLGGALATLAADNHPQATGLYTFGSPRVGNWAFRRDFHVPHHRVVHNLDLITRVPPHIPYISPYVHVGKAKRISAIGQLVSSLDKLGKEDQSQDLSWTEKISSTFKGSLRFLFDHAPQNYAVHSWNLYLDYLSGVDLPPEPDQIRPEF